MRHRYVLKNKEGNCKGGVEHYECQDCGHTFDIAVGYAVTGHTFSSDYKHNDKKHWQICTVCGGAGPATAHDLKQKVFKDCTKTIVTTVCETCGYAHIEHSSGAGHKYTSDGDYDGWYGDSTHHWKNCTVCGYVNKAEHSYKNGVCNVCGYVRDDAHHIEYLIGDANSDEMINVKDATAIQKAAASLITLSDLQKLSADCDGNAQVNVRDATSIQKSVAGISTGLPIGEKREV